jgi:tetrahydromethanopterin S-methyltransferase subunit E
MNFAKNVLSADAIHHELAPLVASHEFAQIKIIGVIAHLTEQARPAFLLMLLQASSRILYFGLFRTDTVISMLGWQWDVLACHELNLVLFSVMILPLDDE